MQCSTDNEEEIGTWFHLNERVRLMVTSQLCDEVNINSQTNVDGANLSLLHDSCHMAVLKEEDM
jgi:hypothetical protein